MAKKKKRRDSARNGEEEELHNHRNGGTEKKIKRDEEQNTKRSKVRTVSIAVPGSIIDNAQSLELATRLAGQIARASTIFRIDEIVVFDSKGAGMDNSRVTTAGDEDGIESGAPFLIRVLEYLETPQYLRKSLFPWHNSLRFVGLLPPLDAPHHLRKHEWGSFREGVTLKEKTLNSIGTYVDVGLSKNVVIEDKLEPGKRLTVAMGTNRHLGADQLHKVVPFSTPREEEGLYWGYKVRYASSISSVFKECPYEGGYDHTIGTSEHGTIVNSTDLTIPKFSHLLIAFGGLAGLEESIEEDDSLKGKNANEVFDSYLNTCPNQGSRTIRTEEAIFISLQYFHEPISRTL
ncbi:hypothetical protein Sjap_007844 [Stephania japonica]|uniref:RNA methyltransferase n=1 Tax=Stephania japonica TaxID=461633 RepID=A0AAP0JQL8_9MAGN